MSDFIDRTVLRLRREYESHEIIGAFVKEIRKKDIEIGKLKSEIQHLISELKKITREFDHIKEKKVNSIARIEVRKDELYNILSQKNKANELRIKELTLIRNQLILKINTKNI